MSIRSWLTLPVLLSGMALSAQQTKTDTFTVYGNCGMCKETIESSIKKKHGVRAKNWDKNTKILTVTYDPAKTTIEEIGIRVANAGYDNAYYRAPDYKYARLHSCCQYKRAPLK